MCFWEGMIPFYLQKEFEKLLASLLFGKIYLLWKRELFEKLYLFGSWSSFSLY